MRKKHLQQFVIAVALLMPGATAAFGQVAPLSPVPQQISWGSKAFDNTTTYTLQGAEQADSDAVSALRSNLKIGESGKTIVIGEVGDAAVSAYADLVPAKAEGYYLKVSSDQVVIAGHDSVGTFYGVQTFLQIAAQPEVMSCTVTDYPSVAIRGVVEGFYGNPWSQNDRLRQFDFYGANKLNTYIYGPKDDVYHRSQWKVDYPAAQAALLKALVERANHNKVRFVWAIHPGGSIKWTDSDGDGVIDDFVACKKKLESVYKLGVREFAVFFDDIDGEGKNAANQAALMNYLDTTLRAAHPDIKPFILCPTEYNRAYTGGNNTYLTTLGTKMNSSVNIMWTGNSVVDMIDYSDMTWINDKIKRKAYIWLNYPVNDYCINHMLMGPTYGNAKNIASLLSGFTANPMEYAEASKVSLFSIADYTWNMTKYDDKASWKRAINYLWPAQPAAFRIFCQNNIDLGQTAHGLRRAGESPEFASVISAYSATNYSQAVMDSLKSKLDSMLWAAQTLMADTTQPEILNEIKPWLQVMECVAKRGLEITAMSDCLQKSPIDSVGFMNHYLALDSIYSYQKTIRSRNYSGSIKNPNPVVANEVLVPFLKTVQNNLVSQYRKLTDYGSDLLPKLVIPDGRYYIKNEGKYLTYKSGNTSNPVFQATKDITNPQRQEWEITIDPQSGYYKVVSMEGSKYVNELGNFGVNDYLSDWNTYSISMFMGKYAIQNTQSAGQAFWSVGSNRINKGTTGWTTDRYIFTLENLDEKLDSSTFVLDEPVYIRYNGKYLTATVSKQLPLSFVAKRATDSNKSQQWKFSIDSQTKRLKLVSAGKGWYVNEKGVFGTNDYYSSWNSYAIRERGGKVSIQNQGDGGTDFWNVNAKGVLSIGGVEETDSYMFEVIPVNTTTGIVPLTIIDAAGNGADATGNVYNIKGQMVRKNVKVKDATRNLEKGVYIVNGRKVVVK
jgi:hyaluronoglucosaminidase